MTITKRDRRALIVGAGLLVPALAFRYAVQPAAHTFGATHAQLAVQRDRLARELALLAVAPTLGPRARAARRALEAMGPRLFEGQDELGATAALTRYVGETAADSRVLVEQLDTRPAEPAAAGLFALGADMRAKGDFEGILSLVSELEAGEKLVRVERLAVERVGEAGAGPGAPDTEVLSVALTVRGYADLARRVATRPAVAQPVAQTVRQTATVAAARDAAQNLDAARP